jgi:hypothetical protein
MSPSRMLSVALAVACCALAAPVGVGAVVPPRDCGRMTLKGKPYQVKVDQISCADGRGYARDYVVRKAKPRGYRCREYPSRKGRVRFYCANGRKVVFAIRR